MPLGWVGANHSIRHESVLIAPRSKHTQMLPVCVVCAPVLCCSLVVTDSNEGCTHHSGDAWVAAIAVNTPERNAVCCQAHSAGLA